MNGRRYRDHKCPKYSMHEHHSIPIFNPRVPCLVCREVSREYYSQFVDMLPALRAWIADGEDLTSEQWGDLHFHFCDELPYGVMTGDTGTIDEWLCDRPDHIEELIATIEDYCGLGPEEKAV